MKKPRLAKGDTVVVIEPGGRPVRCEVTAEPRYDGQWFYAVTDGRLTAEVTDGDLDLGDVRRAV